ncbi:MAG: peptidoglycan DD-metalloendopeptidase family protein [Pyrinomonadaceae bacterium]
MRSLTVLISIVFLSLTAFSQLPAEKVQKMADLFVSAYNAKNYALIEEQFNATMKTAIPADKLNTFLDGAHRDLGKIAKLGPPKFLNASAASFPVDFEKAKMAMTVALDAEGKIAGFQINVPAAIKPRNTSRNKTELRLPFKGEWLVFWGGDTVAQNYHQDAATQRFAFDILKVDAEGKTHKGDGSRNEDYYAFGQEIVADADGVVTDVVTGVHDNVPGVMNPLMAVGNFVMIRHANGEISVFCHIKYGTTRVKTGDKVKKGQVIGLCGNSGNSTEAHLHYQVQGTRLFEDENSMKVFFEKIAVKRDGKTEEKTQYSPVKGEIVSQK